MNFDFLISFLGILIVISIVTFDMFRTPLKYFKSRTYDFRAEDVGRMLESEQGVSPQSLNSLTYLDMNE